MATSVTSDGSINEVDLLVVSLYKIYLVEIKSRPGRVSGNAGTGTWTQERRHFTEDNPLLLANRKAKKLKSLLLHQSALRQIRTPFIEAIVFSRPRASNVTFPARHAPVCTCATTPNRLAIPTLSRSCMARLRPWAEVMLHHRRASIGGCHKPWRVRLNRPVSNHSCAAVESAPISSSSC